MPMGQSQIKRMFRAFSDPTRLRILHLLLNGELSVSDLVRVLRVPQPTVSRHLAYLRKAGLVLARRKTLWIHYRLTPARTEFHRQLLACVRCCFRDVPQFREDEKRVALLQKAGKRTRSIRANDPSTCC